MPESQDFRKHHRERASSKQRATEHNWQRSNMVSSKQSERTRNARRDFKLGFGCLLTFCAVALGFVVGVSVGVLLVYLFLLAFSATALMSMYGVLGVFVGIVSAFAANPVLRRLCYHLKRRHLQRHGIAVEAIVVHQQWEMLYNPRGPAGDRFELTLSWQHPDTGQSYEYVRTYLYFFGLTRKKRELFGTDYRSGAHLPLFFSPKHPWYYVVDIPFIPTWFDVLF
ncbi:MAG TPA: hypothetical protein VKY19_06265 [Ktedonosporobacter sp.]|nr:hypothetical protein [Ktedonosporobacter sp.]